jgi:23S rRNA pseudouridine1911/1915/1917 synthase
VEFIDQVRIVFEDESVIVVDKPTGLLTIGTDKEKNKTAYAITRAYLSAKRPPEMLFIVHRLDREASGLLVFAKNMEAKERLQDQFKDHSAGRQYIAVVEGRVQPDDLTIRSYLRENSAFRVYSTRSKGEGKLAITHVHVVKRSPRRSLLEIRLETGRKHQIRVHLAERGHPIVGDKNYGNGLNPIRRLALHGAVLGFKHPVTEKWMSFVSRYPKIFDTL